MTFEFPLVINGKWRAASDGQTTAVEDPATGNSIGRAARASAVDVDEALEVALHGQREWSAMPPWRRGEILKKGADRLRANVESIAKTMTLEQGKPIHESREEIQRSADFIEWAGEEARRIAGRIIQGRDMENRLEIEVHPVGPVAAFTPWNFPMALAAKKFAGALGAGCSIICKPASETPGSVLAIARALLDAGVTPEAISVLCGDAAQISSRLIESPVIAKVTFTGSIPIGKRIAEQAGRFMKPTTMELGGHAPAIICGDVDPIWAADYLAAAKFKNAGQICLSPSRFFVEKSIASAFTARLVERARTWRVGSGFNTDTQMGPLINERRLAAISALAEDARARGATVAAGGKRIGTTGYYYAPTVLTDVPPDATILHDEPFGPIVPVLPFDDEELMLHQANALPFGLASYVFTCDEKRMRRIIGALQYGCVGVNDMLTHPADVPLGGWKESGIGTEGGIEILEPYQKTRFISMR